MTLNEIIDLLKTSGKGTKIKVLQMLQYANRAELTELRDSIDIKLELKRIEFEKDKKEGKK